MGNSVFDVFGELNLESKAFEGSLNRAVGKLKGVDAALDSTISKSNKLGDTSATVARRYEKLTEGISAQRSKLLDNALAFEKGEISAKKFASVVTQVEKSTEGLNSRLKDAKARLQELDDTGLTHFQQQITTAVDQANSKLESFRQNLLATQSAGGGRGSGDVFKRLSGFQKTQLSFQANDIITGLASGQNPMQILAQQGGQIVQIFQQGKQNAEGMTSAITASTVAQKAFAAESDAAAKAIAASHQSSTLLGASVVSLGGILAAGLVTILAVWKATKDIEESAQNRLKYEELVTREFNKQNIFAQELAKLRAEAAGQRAFSSFVSTAPPELIEQSRRQLLEQYNAAAAKSADASRRSQAVDAIVQQNSSDSFMGGWRLPKTALETQKTLADEADTAKKEAQAFYDKIIALDAGLEQSNQRRADKDVEVTKFAEQTKWELRNEAQRAANEAYKKYEADKKKLLDKAIDDAKKKAKEWNDYVVNADKTIRETFASTSDNPFVKIFLDAEKQIDRVTESTYRLGRGITATLTKLIETQAASKAFGQSLTNALNASNLRNDARQFLQGYLDSDEAAIRKRAEREIYAVYNSKGERESALQQKIKEITKRDYTANIARQINAIGSSAGLTKEQLAEYDKKVIAITQGTDPSKLDYTTAKAAADARLREAGREDTQKEEAREVQKKLLQVLTNLSDNKALTIDINDPANKTTIGGTSGNVNARYPAR